MEYAGYECETHTVHTPDGYLLNIHRVPRSKNETVSGASPPHRTPILMGHGLAANSEMWTFPGPSLGEETIYFFKLVDLFTLTKFQKYCGVGKNWETSLDETVLK